MADGLTKHKNGAVSISAGATQIDLPCPTVDQLAVLMDEHDAMAEKAKERETEKGGGIGWRAEWLAFAVKELTGAEIEPGKLPSWATGPRTPRVIIDHWLYGPLALSDA